MKSKLIQIPYTIGIIKPHIALKDDKVNPHCSLTLSRSRRSTRSLLKTTYRSSTASPKCLRRRRSLTSFTNIVTPLITLTSRST